MILSGSTLLLLEIEDNINIFPEILISYILYEKYHFFPVAFAQNVFESNIRLHSIPFDSIVYLAEMCILIFSFETFIPRKRAEKACLS